MANSWMHLNRQAAEYVLPQCLILRDPFAGRDCGWVEQMRPLIREFTLPGGRVLDPYCGFASTLVAASLEGREAVGIEIEAGRCGLAQERLAALGMKGVTVLQGDSELLARELPPVDLVLTSLPYFGCGFDSEHPEQLYQAAHYGDYLEKVRATLLALKAVIKPGGYLVVAVENIRIGNHFVPQAWDVARLMMARFDFVEERIIVYDKPDNPASSPLSNRAHEYVFIARNHRSSCDLAASLVVLKALQQRFPEVLLCGSFARWLMGEQVTPGDVDVLLPDDASLIADVTRWLESQSFQVARWGKPVTSAMAVEASGGARYFRAERLDSTGQQVVLDLNFAPSQAFYRHQASRVRLAQGVACIPGRVSLD